MAGSGSEDAGLDAAVARLCRGAERVVSPEGLRARLQAAAGRPLRVKLGLDPTAPDIHLGHAVVLRKARDFQDMGHIVDIVIGDFTGRVGDPSGKAEMRRQLDGDEVSRHARTYVEQVRRVLDPRRTQVHFNSEWLEPLRFADVLGLASRTTVARLLERDDFANRFRHNRPIHLHEFFYALMQAYDSVALRADVELGGTDQTFNLTMGREVQRDYGQEPQVLVLMPLLVGLDGVQKMSKSLGNYVGITDAPTDMFGKLMSLPDAQMETYFLVCSRLPEAEVAEQLSGLAAGRLHPRDVKLRLAEAVVTLYHGAAAAAEARTAFVEVFSRGGVPQDVPERPLAAGWGGSVIDLLSALQLAPSRSEARRLVRQGAVEVDGVEVRDPAAEVRVSPGSLVRAGKRAFCRVAQVPGNP